MSDPFKDALRKMNTCPDCKNDLVCHDQGECLRPTPETDAAFEEFRETCDLSNLENEMAAMERQLAEARQAFAIATDQLVRVQGELRQSRDENARLQNELEKVERILYSLTP